MCNILNKNYYIIQSLKYITSINTLRSIYFANFHLHLRYGILFVGGDSQSTNLFKLQKKVVRLICNVKRKMSSRELFRTLNILPVPCVYIMETVYYIKLNNKGLNQNLAIHDKTWHRSDFQTQFCGTDIFKKNVNNLVTQNLLKNNFKPFYYNRPFIRWMNTCPTSRHPERNFTEY